MPVRELYEWTCECCGVVVTLEGGAINHWPEGWGTVEVEHRNERLGRLTHLSVCGDCLKTIAGLLRGWRASGTMTSRLCQTGECDVCGNKLADTCYVLERYHSDATSIERHITHRALVCSADCLECLSCDPGQYLHPTDSSSC